MPLTEPTRADPIRPAKSAVRSSSRPRLASHVRLRFDSARERHVLLGPESVLLLNDTGAAILGLCDGERTVAGLVSQLGETYTSVPTGEVHAFLARMAVKRAVELYNG